MIFDSIQNKENYREYETLYQILCYLEGLKQESFLCRIR